MYKYINAPYTYIVCPITEPAKSNHLQRPITFEISPGWLLFAGSTVLLDMHIVGAVVDYKIK